MAGSSFGEVFRIHTFGESHGPGLGVIVDGCPAGLPLDLDLIRRDLARRRVGQSKVTSQRQEEDEVQVLSGVFEGHTTGTPIGLVVMNQDADSSKYETIKHLYRPGHADFTYDAKYGFRDYRGGGRSSARETVARVAAGAIAKMLLAREGIAITGFVAQIGATRMQTFDRDAIEANIVRCPDPVAAEQMVEAILAARRDGDSLGGLVEVWAEGAPAGLGEPVFDRLDADIAKALMCIPAVKGVEIGAGFAVAARRGSENNDAFETRDGRVRTRTNNAGGILGGISTGETIVARMAVKPTSSIVLDQDTVTQSGESATVKVLGRHDPCVCPRAVPIAEAMLALVLADHLLRQRSARV
ncbi:MAG: chorismate synthase [Chloroflexi bacterium]|nr:chorismate synthase [Chloroflexota bacterium]